MISIFTIHLVSRNILVDLFPVVGHKIFVRWSAGELWAHRRDCRCDRHAACIQSAATCSLCANSKPEQSQPICNSSFDRLAVEIRLDCLSGKTNWAWPRIQGLL